MCLSFVFCKYKPRESLSSLATVEDGEEKCNSSTPWHNSDHLNMSGSAGEQESVVIVHVITNNMGEM